MDEARARELRIKSGRKFLLERAYRSLTREQVAERAGVPIETVIVIEEGISDFLLEDMLSLLNVLDIDINEFFADLI
ncbi:helix-turn-helix domain-containing protein [Mucilaginibacter sp. SMC90]|uniref:helix-turn-helix domain-containing protein n=1 Tax=Mucilaginibacter sp. SMC90 TaxID=2929803 RepID=UPI001FB1E97E|nr:helix-turn-helix transcriptional regulator [Mucilaginibacter sp. SMC90]UOE48775.1 helix-turn-helix domain-containing protein [Mucilaginibacter sp. SMC90]